MRVVTAPVPDDVPTVAPVDAGSVADHLLESHAVPLAVLAGVDVEDVLGWHAAEHRHRTPSTTEECLERNRHTGHLRHLHAGTAA